MQLCQDIACVYIIVAAVVKLTMMDESSAPPEIVGENM